MLSSLAWSSTCVACVANLDDRTIMMAEFDSDRLAKRAPGQRLQRPAIRHVVRIGRPRSDRRFAHGAIDAGGGLPRSAPEGYCQDNAWLFPHPRVPIDSADSAQFALHVFLPHPSKYGVYLPPGVGCGSEP
jgi:hypothetical protein